MKKRIDKFFLIGGIGLLAFLISLPYLIGEKDVFALEATEQVLTTTGVIADACSKFQTDWNNCKQTARFTTKGDNCQKEYTLLKANRCPIKFTVAEQKSSCPQLQKNWDACKGTDRFQTKGDGCQAELNALQASNCPIDTGPCREGAIRNQMYCPGVSPLRAYRNYVCQSGNYVWEDVHGGEGNCADMNCSDPDHTDPANLGGGDRQIRSTTSGVSHGVRQSLSDFCALDGNLVEYYCRADGVRMSNRSFSCPEGERCQDGACVGMLPPPPPGPGACIMLNRCGTPGGGGMASGCHLLFKRGCFCW